MNDIIEYTPHMPGSIKRQMDNRISNITQIAATTKVALEVQASIHQYGWFTMLSEANQARFLFMAYEVSNGDNNLEIVFQKWLNDLETQFDRIYLIMGNKLADVLADMPTEFRPVSIMDEIFDRMYSFFFGNTPSPEPPANYLLQLEADAKRAISSTAMAHVSNIPKYINPNGGGMEVRDESKTP